MRIARLTAVTALATFAKVTALATLSAACAEAAPLPPRDGHDTPVAANEPRATVNLVLDLPQGGSCEEAFDLALYSRRTVDLIEWQPATLECTGRKVKVRYLSSRVSRDEVLKLVKAASVRMEVGTP
jgi:hypothetical protein